MSKKQEAKAAKPACPYCDGEVQATGSTFCKPCGVTLKYCSKCDTAVKREADVCPQCGGKLEWK